MSTAWTGSTGSTGSTGRAGWLQWLASPELTATSGHCLSWSNPGHPGYAYPEISGLLLHLLSLEGVEPARRRQLTTALVSAPSAAAGVARDARRYTFDTAMALRGLLTQATEAGPARDLARTWAALLVESAERASPSAGDAWARELRPDTHWSEAFGAHQAKVCGALVDAQATFGELPGIEAARSTYAAAATDAQEDDGRFRTHRLSGITYLHSHCYAVEGLIQQAAEGGPELAPTDSIRAGARWLATVQQADGGLRAWHDGRTASGEVRADATAQALRIWTLVDPDAYGDERRQAAQALSGLAVPGRGLRYAPGSRDVSSWSTIFGYQAMTWHGDPGRADPSRVV